MSYQDNISHLSGEVISDKKRSSRPVKGGKFVTKPAPVVYWKKFIDSSNRGLIPVLFQGEIVKARPKFPSMTFKVPTPEFIEKYFDNLGIFIEVAPDYPGRLWWTGFEIFEDNTLPQIEDYPYQKLVHFDESWEILTNSKEGSNKLTIRNVNGSLIEINPAEQSIDILNEETGSSISLNSGNFTLKDGSNNFSIDSSSVKIGSGTLKSSTKGEEVEDILINLIIQLNSIINNLTVFTTSQTTVTTASGALAPLAPAYQALAASLALITTELTKINTKIPTIKSTKVSIA